MAEPRSDDPAPIIEVTVAAPIDEVWPALRDPGQLRNWHGWEYDLPDGTDALEAEIQTIYFNPTVIEEPPHRLSLGTDVFELAEVDGGVRVRITRAPRGADPDWDAYYDDITEGWRTFLFQLKWALERHPGQTRVTHFTAGTPHRPGPVVSRLGLLEIAAQPVGSAFTTVLPMGLALSGTVFFRTEHQLGLTVAEWGDGLLEVADSPPAPHRPVAGSAAILSLYGLGEDAVTQLRATWDRWWDREFQAVTMPGEPSA
ncbi:MAG: SRPBCC domain-containing protein [Nakamurella multipartita]|jgi:uncharacterized protein YndB with AHSA1/START domain